MPTAGDMVPGGTTALAREIADLKRQVRELRGARRAENTSITNGQWRALKPDGSTILGIGLWPNGRYGTEFRRDDGSLALSVSGQNTSVDNDMFRAFSRDGSVIMMDDAWADGFLGRPFVPVPMSAGKDFTFSTWATTHVGTWWVQHAVLDVSASVVAPASTTAQIRFMINIRGSLVQLGSTTTATNAEVFFHFRADRTDLADLSHGDQATVLLQAQRTSGTGTCTSWCQGVWGSNTYSASEA